MKKEKKKKKKKKNKKIKDKKQEENLDIMIIKALIKKKIARVSNIISVIHIIFRYK
jgi:hypothetical protein